MKYLDLNEGQRRLAVVEFEMQYGKRQFGLVARAMEKANPDMRDTHDHMYEAVSPILVIKAIAQVEKETESLLKTILK